MGALPLVPPGTVTEAEERTEDSLWGFCLVGFHHCLV
jgi:hypothetical protein